MNTPEKLCCTLQIAHHGTKQPVLVTPKEHLLSLNMEHGRPLLSYKVTGIYQSRATDALRDASVINSINTY